MKKLDLIKIIGGINSDFLNGKLAYLAMTSKIEGQLRDAISHQIHLHHYSSSSSLFVCREWNKIDAAVVDLNNNPEFLFEFKSHNSIDFPGFLIAKSKTYPMIHDINKLVNNATLNTDSYFIFFNNVVKSETNLPPNLRGEENNPIAYHSKVNKIIGLPYIDKVKRVINNWVYLLQQLRLPINLTSVVEFNVGKYRGIEVSILAFIYGPINKLNSQITNSLIIEGELIDPKFESPELKDIDWSEINFYFESDELNQIDLGLKKHIWSKSLFI